MYCFLFFSGLICFILRSRDVRLHTHALALLLSSTRTLPPLLVGVLGHAHPHGRSRGRLLLALVPTFLPPLLHRGGEGGGESAIPSGGFGGAAPGAVVCLCVMCACLVGWA